MKEDIRALGEHQGCAATQHPQGWHMGDLGSVRTSTDHLNSMALMCSASILLCSTLVCIDNYRQISRIYN